MQNFDIYYDGECPVCSRYVLMSQLKKKFNVRLFNLREHPEQVKSFWELGYDVDKGMLIEIKGEYFFGADAIYIMSYYGEANSPLGFMMHSYFKRRALAGITYPLLRFGRNVLLKILGLKKINKE